MEKKSENLKKLLIPLVKDGLCIAFSGGVDSTLLLKMAMECKEKHGGRVQAVLFATQLHPAKDEKEAAIICEEMGAPLEIINIDEFLDPEICKNPPDRCYRCKRMLFEKLNAYAKEHGFAATADGTNFDDLSEYRPGLRALQELSIRSPLMECEFTKEDVRRAAKLKRLSVSRKPATPCLATRLPYGTELTPELLHRIEEGEEIIKSFGFPVVRFRVHENMVRLEIPPEDFSSFLSKREKILEKLEELGFLYLTLDLKGFRSGSMDEPMKYEAAR